MSAEQDIGLDEKRVYAAKHGRTAVYLATGAGLARVSVSADRVGEFGLERRGETRDVAGRDGRLAVATPEDVLVADGEELAGTGFGPAAAVGFHDGDLYAAGEGRVARYADGWTETARIADVRALSGGMVAAAGGVYRADGTSVGLADARDVAVGRAVYAATGDGLYWLANGWREALAGAFETVACAPDGRAHAASADTCHERAGSDDEWRAVDGGRVTDFAYAEDAVYAVTADGTFLADAGDVVEPRSAARETGPHGEWRERALGLPDVRAMAVPSG